MILALISDVFFDRHPQQRLRDRLADAKHRGAELAVLPELPLNPWSPATTVPLDDDAEGPGGPRAAIQAAAAREVGIGLVGGVILRDEITARRSNTALVFTADGSLVGTYAKCHLPEEVGFWETSHYQPGETLVKVFRNFSMPIGIQICSDINRPVGSVLLAAAGAHVIVAPRATEAATFERWMVVFRAIALTTGRFVVSVNRPAAENGVLIGGPSIAVAPNGRVLMETTDAVGVVHLNSADIAKAREDYPGYLPMRADLYADEWARIAGSSGHFRA